MENIKRRFSMNTILKDARIFEEDSNENSLPNVKDDIEQDLEESYLDTKTKCKTEEVEMKSEIKQELFDEDTNFPITSEAFENIHIKKEVLEELGSPMKIDVYEDSNSRKSLKSAKFTSFKKRESPYKTVFERLGPSASKVNNPNFDEKTEPTKKKSRKNELEMDAEVLSRRQKQIDYGKNTIGYDEYSKQVPKSQRKADDPQTPNKYLKYSRRGWDGLIKQWRLKLHKYDPQDS